MASVQLTNVNGTILCKKGTISLLGFSSALPLSIPRVGAIEERAISQGLSIKETTLLFSRKRSYNMTSKKVNLTIPRCSSPSNSTGNKDEPSDQTQIPFGYTRKDVLLIGLGHWPEKWIGVDPLQAGNAVQLIFVLGLTIGWISTYLFRVANKEMTYAQQLRDYESKVMEKRLEGLTEAELEALLEQVEEEKRRLASGEQVN